MPTTKRKKDHIKRVHNSSTDDEMDTIFLLQRVKLKKRLATKENTKESTKESIQRKKAKVIKSKESTLKPTQRSTSKVFWVPPPVADTHTIYIL